MALFALSLPAVGQAAFPGENGKIAFSRAVTSGRSNPDGSGQVNLTNDAATQGRLVVVARRFKIAYDQGNSQTYIWYERRRDEPHAGG